MNFFDAKQKFVISYIDKNNRKRVIFDTIANIYKFFINNNIKSFYFIDNAMDWQKANSIECSDITSSDKTIKITTNMGHEILLSSRNRNSSNIANLSVNAKLPMKSSFSLQGDIEYINQYNQVSMNGDLHYSYRKPNILGYLDGIILGGFTNLRGSIDGTMGKMSMTFERDYDLSRKNKIIDAVRCVFNFEDKVLEHDHDYMDETDNTTGLTKITFRSQRIAQMILDYYNKDIGDTIDFIDSNELISIKGNIGILDNGDGLPEYIKKYIELAKDKELNPNGHEANDPIIRRELDEAYQKWLFNKDNDFYSNNREEIEFNGYINPNVLLESKEFRKGIIDGFLDSSSLTLHIDCLSKELADEIEMIGISVGFRTNRSEKMIQINDYNILVQDIMIDKLSNANYIIKSKTEESPNEDKIYGINVDNEDNLILLPCGVITKI